MNNSSISDAVLTVAVLVMAGCAVPAPPGRVATAVVVPVAWSQAPQPRSTTPLAQWWQRFNDPVLVDLINEALAANTSVRTAVAALAQSRALSDVQAAGLLPSLSAQASAQRNRAGNVQGNATVGNAFKAGFDASWEPDVFGGKRSSFAASNADRDASVASLGDVQVSIAAEVAVNYVQLRGLQARLVVANANLQSQLETLQITRWRNQAGLVTDVEVEQARADVAQTQAQIPLLQKSSAQAQHSIAALTGRAPLDLQVQLAASPQQANAVQTPADDLVLAFPRDTLRQRPDVRAAEAKVNAAFYRVAQADAQRYPKFQLGGSLGLSAMTLGSLTNGSSVVASLLASMAAPIFDGGAARAQVRAQQAALLQAGAGYDAAVLTALKDVEDALTALANDRLRLQSLRTAASSAQTAAVLASQRYRSGLVDFQVVLLTQRTALTTQDGVASSASDLNADHVRLYKALGGGWVPTTATGAPLDKATTP
jgi:multidrug efflux system outer membrane protein